MSGLHDKIRDQIEEILSEKGIYDFDITFTNSCVCVKINDDKVACARFKKFPRECIFEGSSKWIRYLTCKIDKALVGCFCVWNMVMTEGTSFQDVDFTGVDYKIKDMFIELMNGFSCFSNKDNMEKLEEQNQGKFATCCPAVVVKTNADNRRQTVGPFIPRLGVQNSSRAAGTRKPAFPIPANIFAIVVDTGILRTHPDLKSKIITQYCRNFSTPNRNNWNDDNGHGTHVAGIIGAQDNTIGIVGNAPNVNLIAVKVLNRGSGSDANVIAGLNYVAQWKTANPSFKGVVNMSLGGSPSATLDNAVRNLINRFGITVVVAAGNESTDARNFSPSRVVEAITVGSYRISNNTLSSFSNFGPVVDLLAPGDNIDSCYLKNSYAFLSGTSMASPMVAGAAIDIISNPAFANYTPAQIRDKLVADANVLNPVCYNRVVGNNPPIILNAAAIAAITTNRSVYIGTY